MRHRLLLPILLTLIGFLPARAASAPDPSAVVKALYHACIDHSNGFDAKSVDLAKPYLAPDLYARIQKKLNKPTPKGDAPDIEGDLFLDAQELPTSYTVSYDGISEHGRTSVKVTLIWSSEKRTYTVFLKQIDGAWKVTDIDYGGKEGLLTDLLK